MKHNFQILVLVIFFSFTFSNCGRDKKTVINTITNDSTIRKTFVVDPIPILLADSFEENYMDPTSEFLIPHNWYLEIDTLKYLLQNDHNIDVLGIRFYGALHNKNKNDTMKLVIVPVGDLGGADHLDDLILPFKVFQYTRTCPNLCGIQDQANNVKCIASKGIVRTRAWYISKEDLEACYLNNSDVKFLKIERLIEENYLKLSICGVDKEHNHTELTTKLSDVGVPCPSVCSMDNIFMTP